MRRSADEVGQNEQADHGEGDGYFHERAEDQSQPGGDADAARLIDASVNRQLPDQRAEERSEEQPRQAEEQSHDGSEQGSPDGAPTGAELLRAERRSGELDNNR